MKKHGWLIFYEDNGKRFYFRKLYKIGRVRFSRKEFALFDDIFAVNDQLKMLEKPLKLYPIPSKLMAAEATITE